MLFLFLLFLTIKMVLMPILETLTNTEMFKEAEEKSHPIIPLKISASNFSQR